MSKLDQGRPCATTTLTDRQGAEHYYELYPIKVGDAFDLSEWLTATIGAGVEAVTGAIGGSAGASFASLGEIVFKRGGMKKAIEILRNVSRDGRTLINEREINNAYSMNLAEMFSAIAWVLGELYGDFLPAATQSSGQNGEEPSTADKLWTIVGGFLQGSGLADIAAQLRQADASTRSTAPAPSSTE